jgi:hypothetical protein
MMNSLHGELRLPPPTSLIQIFSPPSLKPNLLYSSTPSFYTKGVVPGASACPTRIANKLRHARGPHNATPSICLVCPRRTVVGRPNALVGPPKITQRYDDTWPSCSSGRAVFPSGASRWGHVLDGSLRARVVFPSGASLRAPRRSSWSWCCQWCQTFRRQG